MNYTKLIISFFILSIGCSTGQTGTTIDAVSFNDELKKATSPTIIDVRTPSEFEKGHLIDAKNIDYRSDSFETKLAGLDKKITTYIYCLSGGRSTSAKRKMLNMGFEQVIELEGGIMQWRANNLPETVNAEVSQGMTLEEYNKRIKTDKKVLVDFYAQWCGPCMKMKPFLAELSSEYENDVEIIRIDVDKSPLLSKQLSIEALPTLILYKGGVKKWNHTGFLEKSEIETVLKN